MPLTAVLPAGGFVLLSKQLSKTQSSVQRLVLAGSDEFADMEMAYMIRSIMNGVGNSASTPRIATAGALWLEKQIFIQFEHLRLPCISAAVFSARFCAFRSTGERKAVVIELSNERPDAWLPPPNGCGHAICDRC